MPRDGDETMSDDATLSSFGGDEPTEEADDEPPAEAEPTDEVAESSDDEDSEVPASPSLTYTSSPDGETCAACGATVQRRWRAGEGAADPDALVCPDCEVW